jgi:dGTPase
VLDFRQKITSSRPYSNNKQSLNKALESDRGRIISSAAIRRLQQKTQVFPLERNAAVRSRLTHSMEVQQVGRFIVQSIFEQLSDSQQSNYGLTDLARSLESLVEMACLMHDIGNPPFGHFGEAAINHWFAANLDSLAKHHQLNGETWSQLARDLKQFEGNAQAIRIIHSLLALNLTYAQAASILKYTRPAWLTKSDIPTEFSYLMKKVGYYYSEKDYIGNLQNALAMQPGCRHPASYIMEAADDISYCLADIEDAVEKGIISTELLAEKLIEEYQHSANTFAFSETDFMAKAIDDVKRSASRHNINYTAQFFINLRVKLTHPLVKHATKRFINHIEAIYNGQFNQALLEDNSYLHGITATLKNVAIKHVFCHKEVERLELQGYRIISGLLACYQPLLKLSNHDFRELIAGRGRFLIESRLLNKLPNKHKATYLEAVEKTDNCSSLEFYYRCRLLQDYISGMTDQFAYDEYRTLMVTD